MDKISVTKTRNLRELLNTSTLFIFNISVFAGIDSCSSSGGRKYSDQASKRLQSEGGVRDMIYGRLDWKWDTPPTPPRLHAHSTYMHKNTYMNTHSECDCSYAVKRWEGRGSSLFLFAGLFPDMQPLTSWSQSQLGGWGVRRHSTALLQSKSIYHKISQQMVQIWINGLILDDIWLHHSLQMFMLPECWEEGLEGCVWIKIQTVCSVLLPLPGRLVGSLCF